MRKFWIATEGFCRAARVGRQTSPSPVRCLGFDCPQQGAGDAASLPVRRHEEHVEAAALRQFGEADRHTLLLGHESVVRLDAPRPGVPVEIVRRPSRQLRARVVAPRNTMHAVAKQHHQIAQIVGPIESDLHIGFQGSTLARHRTSRHSQ
jgi:hypothetical protein